MVQKPTNDNNLDQSAHMHAYKLIKEIILNQEISSFEPLVEHKLALNLGLSRTPVREALRILEGEELVEYKRGRGWRIALLTEADLHEIFELKLMIEPAAASLTAEKADVEDRKELIQISEGMIAAARDHDVDQWLLLDTAFHNLILECVNNRRLKDLVNNLNEQWWRIQVGIAAITGRMEESSEEHHNVARAVEDGNVELASLIMREHLISVQDCLQLELKAAFSIYKQGI